jgi:hypothetical protein
MTAAADELGRRIAAAEAALARLEAAAGGTWRRHKAIGLRRRAVAGLKARLAALKAGGPASRASLPVPADLLSSGVAVELANSLGRRIRFNGQTSGTVVRLNPPSGTYPDGSVGVEYDGGDRRTFDYRGLHGHMRAGTFRWHDPKEDCP